MKKLLFSASILLALIGCKESQKTEATEKDPAANTAQEAVSVKSSEAKKMNDMPPVEKSTSSDDIPTIEEGMGNGKTEEPKHGSPDQNKIDSIKAAKQKGKK